MYTLKKGVMVLAVVFIMLLSGFFGRSLMYAMAEEMCIRDRYYYEGYSTGQVAELLGRKESSVRSNLKRGREKLKMILKEAYDFE